MIDVPTDQIWVTLSCKFRDEKWTIRLDRITEFVGDEHSTMVYTIDSNAMVEESREEVYQRIALAAQDHVSDE